MPGGRALERGFEYRQRWRPSAAEAGGGALRGPGRKHGTPVSGWSQKAGAPNWSRMDHTCPVMPLSLMMAAHGVGAGGGGGVVPA